MKKKSQKTANRETYMNQLLEANHVIHYSRWWNPAKEDQASDRVYRIGQNRPGHIYLPIGNYILNFKLLMLFCTNSLSENANFHKGRCSLLSKPK